jgi:hypothetical protein
MGYPGENRPVISPPVGLAGDHYPLRIAANFFRATRLVLEGSYANNCNSMNVYFVGAVHDDELSDSEVRGSTGGSGVFTEPGSARLKILRNRVHDNVDLKNCSGTQAHGLYVQGTGHLVANNIVYDHSEGYGIQAYPSGSASVFAENTIVDNALGCFVLSYTAPLINNVCAFNGGFVSGGGGLGCVISTNVRFQSGSDRPSACAFSGDLTGDPLFVNRAAHDLHVLAGSSAIDAAQLLYFYSPDADNLVRPVGNGPDIGAYER